MLRKFLVLGAALVAALAVSIPAQAAINGTSHEVSGQEGGICSACHLPHGAVGKRLWPSPAPSVRKETNGVADLCGFCHDQSGTGKGLRGVNTDPTSSTWVYGLSSHGYIMSCANGDAPRMQMYTSGFPYAEDARIDCTSCHDVHNDSASPNRHPFLRASLNTICAGCHGERMYVGGNVIEGSGVVNQTTITWGSFFGLSNPGNHPVGTDISGDAGGGASPITIWNSMKVATALTRDLWELGGHLTRGTAGGVTCVTCHAVHGIDPDAQKSTNASVHLLDQADPNPNFLAVDQNTTFSDPSGVRDVRSGAGNRNFLCEACHVGNTVPIGSYTGRAAYLQSSGQNQHIAQNPGGTSYTHPVDDLISSVTAGVDLFPASWPSGDATFNPTNVHPTPICESCHIPHGSADYARADMNLASADSRTPDYMLRRSADAICAACHASSSWVKQHHPVGITYNSSGVGGASGLSNVSGAANDRLECGSCHFGKGAHNWTGMGEVGLDKAWRPTNNGRFADRANEQFDSVQSLECILCHYAADGTAATKSPTLHNHADTTFSNNNETAAAYSYIGDGTHALGRLGQIRQVMAGTIAEYWTSLGAGIVPTSTTVNWSGVTGGGTGWSRFGGTATVPILVCESCHELEPAKNSNTHLLLARYYEDSTGQSFQSNAFCEACHNPAGTHPMTGDSVPRARGVRTTAILNCNTSYDWILTPTDPNLLVTTMNGTAATRFTCDNCHQAHDAVTNMASFVIDTAPAYITPGVLAEVTTAVYGSYTAARIPSILTGKGRNYNAFCSQCHPY